MTASPATVARSIRRNREAAQAVTQDVRPLAYSTKTGDGTVREREAAKCAKRGFHVMEDILADLPGDRTIGYCACGEGMDTGTWNERNA